MGIATLSEELDIKNKDAEHVLGTYARAPFVLSHGAGMTLYDTEGRGYLDFGAGIAVNALGHADPEIVAAIRTQAETLIHACNLYHTAPQAELAAELCALSFADKVYFCNSGAEANEAAIKFARKVGRGAQPGKTQIVAFNGGFHGRTIGSLALTAREKYQAPFRPLMPDVAFAPFNDIEAAEKLIGPETCAVFVEPIQGEGGINAASPEFLTSLRDRCDRFGALLVFDEIQCGLGRTGKLWAYEHFGIEPDVMTLAKALGGGLPMGAVLMTQRVADVIEVGDHGSTFAGGPIVSQVARVVLRRVSDPDMLAHVNAMGELLIRRLAEISSPRIRAVRGVGLMIGIEMNREVRPFIEAGYQNGVILLNAGPNVLRLLPPLIVGEREIEQLVGILNRIVDFTGNS
ncbi:MAG: aspartate aminotransferase family protein [Anaerolineae bacterium]|nr:aspartate aminotransferase family protein [Anaerolineae bacterium]